MTHSSSQRYVQRQSPPRETEFVCSYGEQKWNPTKYCQTNKMQRFFLNLNPPFLLYKLNLSSSHLWFENCSCCMQKGRRSSSDRGNRGRSPKSMGGSDQNTLYLSLSHWCNHLENGQSKHKPNQPSSSNLR